MVPKVVMVMMMPPAPMMVMMVVVMILGELDVRRVVAVASGFLLGLYSCVRCLKQRDRIGNGLKQIRIAPHFHNIRGRGCLSRRGGGGARAAQSRQGADDAHNFFVHEHSHFKQAEDVCLRAVSLDRDAAQRLRQTLPQRLAVRGVPSLSAWERDLGRGPWIR